MSIWSKMKGFFDKYGGRNGVNSSKNYDDNSYGSLTSTTSGVQYGTYQYHDLNASLKRRASNSRAGKDSTRSYWEYDVTGNTYEDFANYGSNRSGREYSRDKESTMDQFMNSSYKHNRKHMPSQDRERGNTASQLRGRPIGNGNVRTNGGNIVHSANYEAADRNFDHHAHPVKGHKDLYQTPMYGNIVYNADYKAADMKYHQHKQHKPSMDPRETKFWETPEYGNKVYFANYDFVEGAMDPKRMVNQNTNTTTL